MARVPTFSKRVNRALRFVDLFAGLGGFHIALRNLGHRCVFACEIDPILRAVYKRNFGITANEDITALQIKDIPPHDILCAGFPCQPFSKAGGQQGFHCPKWGQLFNHVLEIIKAHKPRYLLFENVPHLQKHDRERTWSTIFRKLKWLGYDREANVFSPDDFGIPQNRRRIFIVCERGDLSGFSWPQRGSTTMLPLNRFLNQRPKGSQKLSSELLSCLSTWQRFLNRLPKNEEVPTAFPLWTMEFGATYPFCHSTPYSIPAAKLRRYKGACGANLSGSATRKALSRLPAYARSRQKKFPKWKRDYIAANRAFYRRHRNWLDEWLPDIRKFCPSLQKLEWNAKGGARLIWEYVIQIRPSGVRIRRPTTIPSLVALNLTQVPIIGWERRYITIRESARLQSLHGLKTLPKAKTVAFRAIGNAVNSAVVEHIARNLVGTTRSHNGSRRQKGRKISGFSLDSRA